MFAPTLATARTQAAATLTQQAVIYRLITVIDDIGGTTVTEQETAAVACRVAHNHEHENPTPERVAAHSTETIYLPYGTDVRVADVISVDNGPHLPVAETSTGPLSVFTTVNVGEPQ